MDFHENEIETFMTNCHANSCRGMKHTFDVLYIFL